MLKKTVSEIMLTLLLMAGMLTLAFNIQLVKAGPKTWYVDDSGGADFTRIQDAIYAASAGDTIFVYNGTYYEHIRIYKSLTLVGENKHATIIDGSGYGPVVEIYASHTNFTSFTARNAGWRNWERDNGIRLYQTQSSQVTDCIVLGSVYGIREISESWGQGGNNVIKGNTVSDAGIAIGSSHASSIGNIVANNTIKNSTNGIYFNSPYNMQIIGNTISDLTGYARYGIHFEGGGFDNTVVGNTVIGYTDYGIAIRCADENLVSGNNLLNNFYGIELSLSSCDNIVTGNNVSGNGVGISVFDNSNNNLITMNDFSDSVPVGFYISDIGIWVESSHENTIHCNNITNNGCGFYLPSSSNNKIYHNNIVDNTIQVYSFESANTWDDGYPSGGNYWSDYSGQDLNEDRIGDTPYVIDQNNQDRYPLMKPWAPPDISIFNVVPSATEVYIGQVVNITVVVQNEGKVTETFTVTCKYELEGVEHTIGTQTVTNLAPNTATTLTFTWTTTDITVHTIKAEVPPLTGETDTADNTLTSPSTVRVKMLGDVNGDGVVEGEDIFYIARAYGTYPGHPLWNPIADLDNDDSIDGSDIFPVVRNFGKTYP